MQLVAVGAQDQFISGSPQISYFKIAYRRHTNFSMESIRQTFNTKPTLNTKSNLFTCRINRVADLLQDIILAVELPNIYSSDKFRFRWVKNIGNYMINTCSIRIDTQLIDQLWGEWMDVWNELSLSADRRDGYNKLTGNVDEFMNPRRLDPYIVIDNNNISYSNYPIGTSVPSINSRRLFVPLPFWFTKNPGLAIPLVALQYQAIDITIEFRSIEDLYQVYSENVGLYLSPSEYRNQNPTQFSTDSLNQDNVLGYPNEDVSIQRFLVPLGQSYTLLDSNIDIDAYLECNFVFLDEAERKTIALQSNDYLIERVIRLDREGVTTQATIDLVLQNPVKEIIWITRRGDTSKYNSWSNFTNTIGHQVITTPILNTAKLLWNGMERFEEKSAEYFNYIQPFRHHTRCPRDGIYVYSFAIHPERQQPSGSFNASTINKIQMYVTTNSSDIDYDFVFYTTYYNVFRVMSGSGGMVFAN